MRRVTGSPWIADFQKIAASGNEIELTEIRQEPPVITYSRPQRPRSFWSAPRIATSGQVQRHSGYEWLCKHSETRINQICQTWLWACVERWEVRESRTSGVGPGQRSRFLVLTKRSAASGDENGYCCTTQNLSESSPTRPTRQDRYKSLHNKPEPCGTCESLVLLVPRIADAATFCLRYFPREWTGWHLAAAKSMKTCSHWNLIESRLIRNTNNSTKWKSQWSACKFLD